jgi:hypothetical protein
VILALPSLQLRSSEPQEIKSLPADRGGSENAGDREIKALKDARFPRLEITEAKVSPTLEFSASSRLTEHEMQIYRRLDEMGYLTRPVPETPLSHFLDRTFTPEMIHLGKGKAVAGCTLYTAIKRKNPLCLLNPMVLFFSW